MDIRDLIPWTWPRGTPGEPEAREATLRTLQTDLNRAFESFWRSFAVPTVHANWGMTIDRGGLPIDLVETSGEIEVSAEMPGLEEGDIEIGISDDVLTIRAEKHAVRDRQGVGYRINERFYGTIQRTVALPARVDPDRVTALFRNGVLTITVPKVPSSSDDIRRIVVTKG